MFVFLYHFFWTLVLAFFIPIAFLLRKERLFERLALKIPSDPLEEGSIWVHALSVGEVVSAIPLVKALGVKYPAKNIVLSVTTSKGMAIARSQLNGRVKALLTMPIDSWWSIRRIVNYVRPSIFILVETDIWPALINYLRNRGIKSILVNGRVSPRSFKSFKRFSIFARIMFDRLESCLMQSDLDSTRLLQVGLDPEKVRTVGNIKFDRDWVTMSEEEREEWLGFLRLDPKNLLWVAGSTHPDEELVLLRVFRKLRTSFATLRLILAPRKIELSEDIRNEARDMGFMSFLKTELKKEKGSYDVLILNTMGELGRVYGLSKVSFVGGSLVPVGGHNLLEPASFGCPVVFGPHTYNFVLMSESLIEAGGGLRVHDEEELFNVMRMLLTNSEMCARMGELAKKFVEKNRGALNRVASHIAVCMGEAGGLN